MSEDADQTTVNQLLEKISVVVKLALQKYEEREKRKYVSTYE